jgi:hypothetical protein
LKNKELFERSAVSLGQGPHSKFATRLIFTLRTIIVQMREPADQRNGNSEPSLAKTQTTFESYDTFDRPDRWHVDCIDSSPVNEDWSPPLEPSSAET